MTRLALALLLLAAAGPAFGQSPRTPTVERGAAVFRNNGCHGCHVIAGVGTPIGPDLSHVGRTYEREYLARWLRDPAMQRPSTHMPALELTEGDVQALAVYLASLR